MKKKRSAGAEEAFNEYVRREYPFPRIANEDAPIKHFVAGYDAGISEAPRRMGQLRAESLTASRRKEIARNAGKAGGRGRGKKDKK